MYCDESRDGINAVPTGELWSAHQHDADRVHRGGQVVGPEGEADLDSGDAWLRAEVGEGGGGGRAANVLRPRVYLPLREGVGPGAAHGYAEVDGAFSGHFDDGERADAGRTLLVIVFSQRLTRRFDEQRGGGATDGGAVIGGEPSGNGDRDTHIVALRPNWIVGGDAGAIGGLTGAGLVVIDLLLELLAYLLLQGSEQGVLHAIEVRLTDDVDGLSVATTGEGGGVAGGDAVGAAGAVQHEGRDIASRARSYGDGGDANSVPLLRIALRYLYVLHGQEADT